MLFRSVGALRQKGMPVELELVGPSYAPALKRMQRAMQEVDSSGSFVRYRGAVSYAELPACYVRADMCVFASSCENMPNILLEAMASGLPVVCSNRGPMPEILGDAGVYFDPESVEEIAQAVQNVIDAPDVRTGMARRSFGRAQGYSWKRCADATFRFLSDTLEKSS